MESIIVINKILYYCITHIIIEKVQQPATPAEPQSVLGIKKC